MRTTITACDAANSYGMARVFVRTQPTAQAAERFLRRVMPPHFRRAGWPIQRVLTDGGSEFKGVFDQACRDLVIRHTRTKPRHAWANGLTTATAPEAAPPPRFCSAQKKDEIGRSNGRNCQHLCATGQPNISHTRVDSSTYTASICAHRAPPPGHR